MSGSRLLLFDTAILLPFTSRSFNRSNSPLSCPALDHNDGIHLFHA